MISVIQMQQVCYGWDMWCNIRCIFCIDHECCTKSKYKIVSKISYLAFVNLWISNYYFLI